MAIDVGSSCSDRTSSLGHGYTYVDKANPANATGTIDTVCVYSASELYTLSVASFSATGNDLTTNGTAFLGDQGGSGSKTWTAAGNDFTAFNINSGEYIGCYWTGGNIDSDTSGIGLWGLDGEYIPCTSQTFSYWSTYCISLYATGTEAGAASILPQATYYYNMLRAA